MAKDDKADGVVLADVGGTNVRFAVLKDGKLGPVEHMAVADYQQFSDALAAFMTRRTDLSPVRHALLGVAGVVEGERCALTNNPWVIAASELCGRFGFSDVHIVNDFEAVAWSLPRFNPGDLRMIGRGKPKANAPMVVLGPGTGFGVAAYIRREQGDLVLRSEGGHATLPSGSSREDAIIAKLRERFGHVSVERALSGAGLENLYHAIASLESLSVPECTAAEIAEAATTGRCAISRAALDTFCALLGAVAGNLALGFGAQGGVYVAGGIAPHLRDYLPGLAISIAVRGEGPVDPVSRGYSGLSYPA